MDVRCNIEEVNRRTCLLQELYALDTYLVKIFLVLLLVLELKNAVLLVWFVLLGQDDLIQTDVSCKDQLLIRLVYQWLELFCGKDWHSCSSFFVT